MESSPHESELARRAAGGDEVALTLLLTQLRPRLRGYLVRRVPAGLRAVIDADDVVQNALVQVYRNIASFELRGSDSLFRWVATIAIRKMRDAVRDQRAARRGGGRAVIGEPAGGDGDRSRVALLALFEASVHTPSQSFARGEAIDAVQRALQRLPDDYRQALTLVNIEGRSVAAAATAMGRSERAVHNLCYKARQRLREILGSESRFLSR